MSAKAIINIQVSHDDDDDNSISQKAKAKLIQEIPNGTLNSSKNLIRSGNSKGLTILEQLDETLNEVKKLQTEVSEFKSQTNSRMSEFKSQTNSGLSRLESKIDQTDSGLSRLESKIDSRLSELTSKMSQIALETGFMEVRNGFFAVFLRDRLFDRIPRENQQIIQTGNEKVHPGNASIDALLFEHHYRTDTEIFVLLYGVMPRTVLTTLRGHAMTIAVMNKHASAIANYRIEIDNLRIDDYLESKQDSPLGKLHVAFLEFISALEENGFRQDSLFDNSSKEFSTYQKFNDQHSKL